MFRSRRDVAAWIGLVPRQNSTGGKQKLEPICNQGDPYLRRILVIGAHAARRLPPLPEILWPPARQPRVRGFYFAEVYCLAATSKIVQMVGCGISGLRATGQPSCGGSLESRCGQLRATKRRISSSTGR
jgi:Transposase IS116/IS110/IS902 family